MWLALIGCGPELKDPPRSAPPVCARQELPTSVVMESSVIPMRAVRAIRRRAEVVTDAANCTGPQCGVVDMASFEALVVRVREVLELDSVPRTSPASPHAKRTTVRVHWDEHSCEKRVGRSTAVSDHEGFRSGVRAITAARSAGNEVP